MSRYRNGKYNNCKVEIDGVLFDSRKEANRYQELLLLQRAGMITDLELQPKYDLIVNGCKICRYIGDFRYLDVSTGQSVTEDVKGFRTETYKLKKKLLEAVYDIYIVEVL